jgi:uncharacterized protein
MLGTALTGALRSAGYTVNRLVRPGGSAAPGDVGWNPHSGRIELAGLEGVDAMVHLAGASIAEGRWTSARKQLIRESRVDATRNLVNGLLELKRPPKVLVSASAVGYYGDRGDEPLTEASSPGNDFLAQVARDWEAEAQRAAQNGIRAVQLRFGVILAARGGALPRMLLPFKMGVGGRLGSGKQWMPWLTLQEAVGIVKHALKSVELGGPVNAVSPNPVRNSEFTKILGRVLRRPTLFPAPGFALKLVLGEMADALLLSSQRAIPARLQELNYHFVNAELEGALRSVLRK